jgi:O-acetyl-ADP-ribose deacetylase (regulator of RNase III)
LARTIVRLISNHRMIEFVGPADIIRETTDAIVNAANSSLMGGGGVDGAIHDAGGPAILDECKQYVASHGTLPAGKAMITCGGLLAAKYVVHTVGPVYRDGSSGEAELLASCHRESIRLADERGLKSLSFPAISTGAYGYPVHEAASIAVGTVRDILEDGSRLERVRFVLFDAAALKAYVRAAEAAIKNRANWSVEHSSAGEP